MLVTFLIERSWKRERDANNNPGNDEINDMAHLRPDNPSTQRRKVGATASESLD